MPVDLRLVGSQAFQSALAFNANIGAWNTASVTDVSIVCAASGPAHICMYMYIYVYVCVCVCVCVRACVSVCVCTHTHTHTHIERGRERKIDRFRFEFGYRLHMDTFVYTGIRRRRHGRLHQARRVRHVGGDAAHRVPDVELVMCDAGSDRHAEVTAYNVDHYWWR
jgi:hypothetical protein